MFSTPFTYFGSSADAPRETLISKGLISSSGLLMYLPLENNTNDYSGNSKNFTSTGITYSSDVKKFDSYSAICDSGIISRTSTTGFTTNASGTFTIAFWVYVTVAPATWVKYNFFETYGDAGTDSTDVVLSYYNNGNTGTLGLELDLYPGSRKHVAQTLTTNTWYHFITTYSGRTMTVYMNNSLFSTHSVASGVNWWNGSSTLYFSAASNSKLNIDEISVWNRVIDATERSTLYNAAYPLK